MSDLEALLRSGTARIGPSTTLPTPTALTRMASQVNTTAHIEIIADNQTKTVQLAQTRYDNELSKSIINKKKARATNGEPESIEEISLVDFTGKSYKSQSTINVRWNLKNGAQSSGETFYVVDSCGEYDAMLRKDIMKPRHPPAPQTHPFIMERETAADRERRVARESARAQQAQSANADREGRVRAQYEREREERAARRG